MSVDKVEEYLSEPGIKYMPPEVLAAWNLTTSFRRKNLSKNIFPIIYQIFHYYIELTQALHKAGANIILGTDFPNPYIIPGFSPGY